MLKKRTATIALSAAALGFASLTFGLSPVQADGTCNDNTANGESVEGTPLYTSPGEPGDSTSGYIGAQGSSAAGSGYVEAGGDATNPTGGYVVASDGTSGVEVDGSGPAQCTN